MAALKYENSYTDTLNRLIDKLTYAKLCNELGILAYMPESDKLSGRPNSYIENISDIPNWTVEDGKRIMKETNGAIYIDTTDRDFEKYWYNESGQLIKYESKSFSDIRHNESILSYGSDNLIEKIEINDVVTDCLKYKKCTVKIKGNKFVTIVKLNIVKSSQ